MRLRSWPTRLLAAPAVVLVVAGCGNSAAGGGGDEAEGPIELGAVSSLSGPVAFADPTAAAQAVFDRVNEDGGINGREINYTVVDDRGDPSAAAQASRQLIDQQEVVANVGSASLVDCSANAATYQRSDVVAVQGLGVDPACFSSPNISPVNTGPFAGYTSLMYFASETLGHDKVCAVILTVPGLTEGYEAAVERWTEITGKTPLFVDTSLTVNDDPTPAVLRAKDAGCQAVTFNSNPPQTVTVMKAAQAQGALETIDWIALTVSYNTEILDAFAANNSWGLYVNSEFEPWSGDSEDLDDWRGLMEENDLPQGSDSLAGYVAATIMVEVLEGIDGDITRESVTQAFKELEPIDNPLMGSPYTFGDADSHNPNQASKIVEATPDGWVAVSEDWQRLPD